MSYEGAFDVEVAPRGAFNRGGGFGRYDRLDELQRAASRVEPREDPLGYSRRRRHRSASWERAPAASAAPAAPTVIVQAPPCTGCQHASSARVPAPTESAQWYHYLIVIFLVIQVALAIMHYMETRSARTEARAISGR